MKRFDEGVDSQHHTGLIRIPATEEAIGRCWVVLLYAAIPRACLTLSRPHQRVQRGSYHDQKIVLAKPSHLS